MKINPNWFILSDLHFGHKGLLRFGTRPQGFEEVIVKNWNKLVSSKDKILMLGDLSLTNREETLRYCSRLNGDKYMILGNHDNRSDTWYKDCGFQVVEPIYKTFEGFGKEKKMNVFFTHEPVIPLPTYIKKNEIENHYFNIHGHLHGNTHHDVPTTPHHFDASAECVNLTPVKLADLLARFSSLMKGGE